MSTGSGSASSSSSPQTVADLYGEATADDTTVAADQQKLAADQQQDTLDHAGLDASVKALGLVVIPNADGTFTVLEPNPNGTGTLRRNAVAGSTPIPAASSPSSSRSTG